MAMSVQDSQPPQATGTAASTARNGMTTNAYRAMRTPRACGPSVSGLGPACGAASAVEVMAPHWTVGDGGAGREINYLRLRHRNLRHRSLRRSRVQEDRGNQNLARLRAYRPAYGRPNV